MKTTHTNHTNQSTATRCSVIAATIAVLLAAVVSGKAASNPNPGILPVGSTAFGHTLAEWSAAWWQLGIEHPVDGNPFLEGGVIELSRSVWGIAAPLGGATFEVTVPLGKALFLPAITIECSSLEPPDSGFHGDTEAEQAECATFWANHIIDLSFEIDGVPVQNLATYRVVSPQFPFVAPDPNILGVAGGGPGTAVADGYYVMVAPLSKGVHQTHLRGILHFSIAEGDPFDLDLVTDNVFQIEVK
jgi:hypothetical protein